MGLTGLKSGGESNSSSSGFQGRLLSDPGPPSTIRPSRGRCGPQVTGSLVLPHTGISSSGSRGHFTASLKGEIQGEEGGRGGGWRTDFPLTSDGLRVRQHGGHTGRLEPGSQTCSATCSFPTNQTRSPGPGLRPFSEALSAGGHVGLG